VLFLFFILWAADLQALAITDHIVNSPPSASDGVRFAHFAGKFNPNGIASISPRVGRASGLPWVTIQNIFNPNGVESSRQQI